MGQEMRRAGSALPQLERPVDAALLESALQAGWLAARAAWPEIDLAEEDFLRAVAERLAREPLPLEALGQMALPDLYLCCACVAGLPGALAALERCCIAPLSRTLPRLGLTEAEGADALQRARQALLVGSERTPPALRRYSGRGPLSAFVRVVAVRAARKVRERERGAVDADEPMLDALPGPREDPELAYLKRTYQEEFRAAFRAAVDDLVPEQRLLLRQHLVDGLGIDQLAGLHGVHRATAARRLTRARDDLAESTRRHFLQRVPVDRVALESVLRLIRSQLDLSVRGLLDH